MFMKYVSAFALLGILALASAAPAGILSGLRDRLSAGQTEQFQGNNPAPQNEQQVPPPAEQAQPKKKQQPKQQQQAQPQQQPQQAQPKQQQAQPQDDSAKAPSAGARKLARQLNWDGVPRDLFKRYAGRWEGNFWVYSPLGKKEQVNKVQVEYTPQSNGSMKMLTNSYDMISKTWVVQESATYTIEGDTVYVEIRRPNGDVSRQVGHWSDDQLFLQGQINDGVEHFRERIDSNGRLLVDGFGVYGSTKGKDHHIFIGRMTRQN